MNRNSVVGPGRSLSSPLPLPEGEEEPGPPGDERWGYPPIPVARKGRVGWKVTTIRGRRNLLLLPLYIFKEISGFSALF